MGNEKILLAVTGYPGSGKTEFATKLSQSVSIEYLSADQVARELFPVFGAETKNYMERRDLVLQETFYRLTDILNLGKSIICDANFGTAALRDDLRKIATNAKSNLVFIWLKTPIEVAKRRATSPRELAIGTMRVTQDVTPAVFDRLASLFEPPAIDEEGWVVISGMESFAEQSREFKRQLSDNKLLQIR